MFFDDALKALNAHLETLPNRGNFALPMPWVGSDHPEPFYPAWGPGGIEIKGGHNGGCLWSLVGGALYQSTEPENIRGFPDAGHYWRLDEKTPYAIYWALHFYADKLPDNRFVVFLTYNDYKDTVRQYPGYAALMKAAPGLLEGGKVNTVPQTKNRFHVPEPYGGNPVIILGENVSGEDVSAQLCFYAIRHEIAFADQGTLINGLKNYIGKLINARDEDLISEALSGLIKKYPWRPSTTITFKEFIKRTTWGAGRGDRKQTAIELGLNEQVRKEREEDPHRQKSIRKHTKVPVEKKSSEEDKDYTVYEASKRLGIDRQRLYELIAEGKVTATVSGRKEIRLTKEEFDKSREYLERRKEKWDLVENIAEIRGCSLSATREWLRRQRKKGMTDRMIIEKLICPT
jgi:excisionase family DNA binding protein